MRHKYATPATCNCGGHTQRCVVCDYGLAVCEVCKSGECQIPTDCPGRPMTDEEKELVCRGDLDFDMGVWFKDGRPVMESKRKVFK